jgi:hypothetical protein
MALNDIAKSNQTLPHLLHRLPHQTFTNTSMISTALHLPHLLHLF